MRTFLRILAILLAIYFLVTSLQNIFFQHISAGSLALAFRQSFISIVAAILLFVNPKRLKQGPQLFVYFVGLVAVNVWYSLIYVSIIGFPGNKSYRSIAVGLLILTILWGTFWFGINERFARHGRR
jgi:hypothetical protein